MKISQKPTLENGEEKSKSLPEAFLANLSPTQAKERDQQMTGTSGRKCLELFARSGPLGSWVRMCLESQRWYSPARLLRWEPVALFSMRRTLLEETSDLSSKRSATILSTKDIQSNRCLFRLVPLERPTEEIASSSSLGEMILPTPRVSDIEGGRVKNVEQTENGSFCRKNAKGVRWGVKIRDVAESGLLPTPQVTDANGAMSPEANAEYRRKWVEKSGIVPSATYQLRQLAADGILPTPTARCMNSGTSAPRKDGISRESELNHLIAIRENERVMGLLPTPVMSDYQPGTIIPQAGHGERKALNHVVAKSQEKDLKKRGVNSLELNPLFVEEMMGFPFLWTTLPFLSQDGDKNLSKLMETLLLSK